MLTNSSIRKFTLLLAGIGATSVLGCSGSPDVAGSSQAATNECSLEDENPLRRLSCQLGMAVTTVAPEIQSELLDQLNTYARALQDSNGAAVAPLISTELRERVVNRVPGTINLPAKLQIFVAQERVKLLRAIGQPAPVVPPGSVEETFTLVAAEMLQDGSVAAITVAHNDEVLPKPLFFVRDEGSLKLNIAPPAILEGKTYVAKNEDAVARSFTCSGAIASTVEAGQTLPKFCTDTASTIFDSTQFVVNGLAVNCDFNAFGIDMFIRNNSPICQ